MLKRRIDPDSDPGSECLPKWRRWRLRSERPCRSTTGTHQSCCCSTVCARPSVGEGMRLVREPDAGDLHVRFDERRLERSHGVASRAPRNRKARQQRCHPYRHRASRRLYRFGTVVRAVASTGDNVNKQNAARSALSRPQPVGPIDSFDRAKVRSPDGRAVHCQYWDARTRRALRD